MGASIIQIRTVVLPGPVPPIIVPTRGRLVAVKINPHNGEKTPELNETYILELFCYRSAAKEHFADRVFSLKHGCYPKDGILGTYLPEPIEVQPYDTVRPLFSSGQAKPPRCQFVLGVEIEVTG